MKKELDDLLCEKFPLVFVDRKRSFRETCMAEGFSHGDGWFNIVYMLSAALEKISADNGGTLKAAQVKEKFGSLRFYLDGYPESKEDREKIWNLVAHAEYLSSVTCEFCGRPGSSRDGSWIRTLCDECHASGRKRP